MTIAERIEDYKIHFGGEIAAEKADKVVEIWRDAVLAAYGDGQVEVAASFQRHFTARGTGLPTNFCLALTPTKALVFKFNPRNPDHPLFVKPSQIKKLVAEWPREALRVSGADHGRMTVDLTFEIDYEDGLETVPCRTPRLAINPAAGVVITELGGTLPAS
jgi:hypothetical protein